MRPMMPWLALTLGLAACQTDRPTAASRAADLTSGNEGAVRVYTQNLYVGADVDKVIAAPPAQLPAALFQALATFVATDYPSRAGRMADEIGRQKPDLIGLQEVTHLTVQGLGIVGFPDIDVDFIPILRAQLAARGLHYDVVAVSPNTDITIPLPLPDGSFGVIALKDFDAILVRHGIASGNVVTKNYQAKFSTSLGPIPLDILRGYAAADVTVRGQELSLRHDPHRAARHRAPDPGGASRGADLRSRGDHAAAHRGGRLQLQTIGARGRGALQPDAGGGISRHLDPAQHRAGRRPDLLPDRRPQQPRLAAHPADRLRVREESVGARGTVRRSGADQTVRGWRRGEDEQRLVAVGPCGSV